MGASVAAVIIAKERQIVEAFREAGATSPNAAMTPASLGVSERVPFLALRDHAVLREVEPGRYFLDEPSWDALRRFRRRFLFLVVLVAVIAVGAFLFRRV